MAIGKKTVSLNVISQGWRSAKPGDAIWQQIWSTLTAALEGSWSNGIIEDTTNGVWNRYNNKMNFRIVITPTQTKSYTFTLPFAAKESYLIYVANSTTLSHKIMTKDIITFSVSLTKDKEYVIEAHNISV